MTDRPWSGDPTSGGTLEGSAPPAYPSVPPTQSYPNPPGQATEAVPSPPAPAPPPAQEPAWYPDPGGRHQFRYWDGATWTDQVADGGNMAVEPLVAYGPSPPRPVSPVEKKSRRGLFLILAVVVVLVVAAVAVAVLLLSGGDGSGTFARELENEGDTLVHGVSVGDDTVVLIEVTSDDADFDPVIGVSTDQATIDEYADFFETDEALSESEFAGSLPEGGQLFAVADTTGAGEAERTFVATPFGGDFDVLVTGADDSVGAFDLDIRVEEFAGPDDAVAYLEELAEQDFVEDFAPPRSPIEDVLEDLINEGD